MRFRIWPIVGNAFCVLLALVTFSVWEVLHKMRDLDARTASVHLAYQRADNALSIIRTSVYRASQASRNIQPETRRSLAALHAETDAALRSLPALLGNDQSSHVEHLRQELDDYWKSQDIILDADKARQRDTILEIAEQMDQLNTANINHQEGEVQQQSRELRIFLQQTALLLLLLSISVAGGTTFYLSRIEREAGEQKRRCERAEFELRRLSNQLVSAQEDERKSISRELHDEVGQILTGLRMELGTLNPDAGNVYFSQRLESVKALAEQALRSVRDLAMLLRPSMLDDLGLPAALRYQAKEFTRRTGIEAAVQINGPFDHLPDAHRTCLYRVIQEATTNVARHAKASHVNISLHEDKDLLTASVQDDGQGFEKNGFRTRGLGLVGMEERVRELQGRITVESQLGKGTLIKIQLPLPEDARVQAE